MTLHGGRPLLALVTDGARLAPGRPPSERAACLLAQTRSAVAAGVDLVQLRERDLEAGELCALARAAVAAADGSATRIVVNDRLDVAMAAGAAGVHLRADSLPPRAARALAPPGFLIGRSVHGIDEARAVALDVDYLIAGTVFPTPSKPGAPMLGAAGLAAIAASVNVPVLAIGGIGVDRVAAVAVAGAAGLAAIGLFMPRTGGRGGPCGASPLDDVCADVRMRFDTARTPS
jgi:thiamine-phosphate diphosphorylase